MNKTFKTVFNKSTGTHVAAAENAKAKGKSSKSKLAMKLASASLAISASAAMLSPMNASADEGAAAVSGYQDDAQIPAATPDAVADDATTTPTDDGATSSTTPAVGKRMLGATLLGATGPISYDSTYLKIGGDGTGAATVGSDVSDSIVMGVNATVLSGVGLGSGTISNLVAIGTNATAAGSSSTALGANTLAGYGSTAIGAGAAAKNSTMNAVAIGYKATADENGIAGQMSAVAIGDSTVAKGTGAVALGGNSSAVSGRSQAATAIGYSAKAASAGTALGTAASALATGSVALGSNSVADIDNTLSVGRVGYERQIVNVSAGTRANDVVNYGQLQAAGLTVDTNGVATNAFIAYDDTSKDVATLGGTAGTKLTNVAAGTISAGSTDAVNGSQLYGFTNGSAVANSAYVKVQGLGDGTDNATIGNYSGAIVIGSKAQAINGQATTASNGIAIGTGAVVNASNAISGGVALGSSSTAIAGGTSIGTGAYSASGNATALGSGALANTIFTAAIGAGATSSGVASTSIGPSSAAKAQNSVALGFNSVADIAMTVSVGQAGFERQIVNVSAGTRANDVVNYGQLQAAGLTVDTNGVATNAFIAYDDTSKDVATLGGTAGTKLTHVAAGDISSLASTDAVNGSQLFTTNQNVAKNTTDITKNTGDISTLNTQFTTLNTGLGNAVMYDTSAHGKITLGGGTAGTLITNVAAGEISATSTDAVNGAELYAVKQTIASQGAGISDAVAYDSSAHDSIGLGGTAGTKITKLKAGDISSATSMDAVNGSQLFATNQNVAKNTTDIAKNTSDISTLNTQFTTLNTGLGDAVMYDTTSHAQITLGGGTAGTKLTNLAAGSLSSTSTDAVNGSQLFNLQTAMTNGSTATNSAYVKVGGQGDGSDNAVLGTDTGDNIAIGSSAKADTGYTGSGGQSSGAGAIAIGSSARAVGDAGQMVGYEMAIGQYSFASKNYATAMGPFASATGMSSTALGMVAKASGLNSLAAGMRSNASADNSVALGASSVADVANTVSVGKSGSERQIMNVAAGTRKTDAVNFGQLQGLGLNVDTNGVVTNAFMSYDSTTKDVATLGGTEGTKLRNVAAGDISSDSMDAVNGSQLFATNQNVAVNTTDIANLNLAMNAVNNGTTGIVRQDPLTQAITVGANLNGGMINFAGLQGARMLTGVANGAVGASSTDAVNGSQLFNTSTSVAAALGGGASVDANGGVVAPSYTVGGTQVSDIGSAVGNLDTRVTGNTASIADIQSNLAGVSDTAANAVAYDTADHSKVTLGGAGTGAGPVTLTNVAAGEISATSTDAVNGSQLSATNDRVTAAENSIANIEQALGDNATASGDNATAAGSNSTASGENSTAIGGDSTASGDNSTATGSNSTASGDDSTATGQNSTASGDNSTATGADSTASGSDSTATGNNSNATGGNSTATGADSTASGSDSTATGNNSNATGDNSTATGADSTASGSDSTATGNNSNATGDNSTATGADSTASGNDSTATGNNSTASGENSTATGAGSTASGSDSTATGNNSTASGDNSTATGADSTASGSDSTATGNNSTASGESSTATGADSTASGSDSTATGNNSNAAGDNSTATGANSSASGNDSTATGGNAMASGDSSTASGANSNASGNNSTANGANSIASGDSSSAFGGNSSSTGANSTAIGANSMASGDNSVALGANSVANEANTVSVGSAGNERRITNVAPGVNGTDAVNVNQMNQLRSDVGSSIHSLQRSAFGGVAAAMAMPNLMPSAPGKAVVGAGVANYKGYSALAAGVTYRSGNGHWLVNGAASASQNGDVGVRAQAGYEF